MKRRFLAFLFLILTLHYANAQDTDKQKSLGKIGFTYSSFGENAVFRNESLLGEASYNNDRFYTIGISYLKPISSWLEFETGLEYSKHTILIKPNLPPDMDRIPLKTNFSLINIPLTLRANFWKFFFVNGGLLLDLDANISSPIDSQTGIGGLLGLGVKYDFDCGASIFVNPYLKFHSLIPFSPGDNQQKVHESGFRVGLSYKLDRKQ